MRSAIQLRTIAITVFVIGGMIVGCANFPKFGQSNGPGSAKNNMPDPSTLDVMEEPPVMAETFFAAARLYESQRDDQNALIQFRKAIGADPNYAEAYERLGLLLSRVGRSKEAVAPLVRAVELAPKNPVYRNNLGFEYGLQKRWADAEAELTNAVQLEQGFARAYVNLGLVLCRQGKHEEGLDAFNVALPAPDAFYNLGLMFLADKRFHDAAQSFEHALSLNSQFVAAQNRLEELQPKLALANKFEPVADLQTWNAVESTPNGHAGMTTPMETTAQVNAPVDVQPESRMVIVPSESAAAPVRTASWHAPAAAEKPLQMESVPAETNAAKTVPAAAVPTKTVPDQPVVESKPDNAGVFEFVSEVKEPSEEAPGDAATMGNRESTDVVDVSQVTMNEEATVEPIVATMPVSFAHADPIAGSNDAAPATMPNEPGAIVFTTVQPVATLLAANDHSKIVWDDAADEPLPIAASSVAGLAISPASTLADDDVLVIDFVNPQESRGRYSTASGKALFFAPPDELFIMRSVDTESGESSAMASAGN